MNKFQEFLNKLNHKQLLFLLSAAMCVVSYALYMVILSPSLVELEETKLKADEIEKQIFAERKIASNLPKFREQVVAYKSVQELAQKQLPQKREIPTLLTALNTRASDIGLDVKKFAPGEDKISDSYAEIPIQVEVVGSFHQITSLFDEISRLSRIISISSYKLFNPRGYATEGSVMMSAAFTLVAYRELEESEKRKPEEPGTKKGKGSKPASSVVKK